jgi:hypothetical protein
MPQAPSSYPFARIAITFRARLAGSLGIPQDYVRLVANDRYAVTQTEPVFCYYQFFGPSPPRDRGLDFYSPGAGRLFSPVGRRLRVYVYTRENVDVVGGDEVALTGWSDTPDAGATSFPGHYLAEEKILNALLNWMPTVPRASEGQSVTAPLLLTPVHLADGDGPPERRAEDSEGLVRSYQDYEVVYVAPIDAADPPS